MDIYNRFILALIILSYVLLSTIGLVMLKSAYQVLSYRWITGLLIYGISFAIWIFVILKNMPLSVAFPIAAGMLIISTQLAGYFILTEPISALHLLGIIMIFIGLYIIHFTS